MTIEFVCPACRGTLRVAADAAGRVVRCGSCQTTLRVPAPLVGPDPDPPPPISPPAPPAGPRRPDRGRPAEPVDPPYDSDRGSRDADDYGEPRPRRRLPPAGRGVLFWVLMIFLFLGLLTVAACGGVILLLQAKWRPHQSDRGGFKVELPAEPRDDMAELAEARHQPNGDVEGTVLVGKLEQYLIMYTDVDPATRQQADNVILDETVKQLDKDTPGLQVLRNGPATLSGLPAREVVFTHPNGGTYVCRIAIVDTRLYIVLAGGPWVTPAGNERVRRFLDSFQVTDPKLLARQKKQEETRRLAEEGPRRARERTEPDD